MDAFGLYSSTSNPSSSALSPSSHPSFPHSLITLSITFDPSNHSNLFSHTTDFSQPLINFSPSPPIHQPALLCTLSFTPPPSTSIHHSLTHLHLAQPAPVPSQYSPLLPRHTTHSLPISQRPESTSNSQHFHPTNLSSSS